MPGRPDSWFEDRRLLIPLAILLAAFLLARGILPSLSAIATDFPNYYTASRIVLSGGETARLYDDAWFQEQMRASGFVEPGKFSPFPPSTALIVTPLAFFTPQYALRIMTLINFIFLVGVIVLLVRLFELEFLQATVIVLLAGTGLANCFRFGQLYIPLAFFMLLSLFMLERRRSVLAGLSAGILLPVKYFSVLNVVDFARHRNWPAVASAILGAAVIVLAGVLVLGAQIHYEFIASVLPNHLRSNLTLQDPFSTSFQSFDSLLRRLFLFDNAANPRPIIHSPALFFWSKSAVLIGVACLTVFGVVSAHRSSAQSLPIALMSLAGLLIAPATGSYHFVLLWLPVAVMVMIFHRRRQMHWLLATLVLFGGIGFLPISWGRVFESSGILRPLAYPRLALLTILFGLGILACRDSGRNG